MSARRQARLMAVQLLYQQDLNPGSVDEALEVFWREHPVAPAVRDFTEALVRGVLAHRADIDAKLRDCAEHWDLNRMDTVDRNILRVAAYEMLFRDDIPPVVSIDEAIELAKAFNGHESARFVNGLLDRIARELPRPPRVGRVDPRFRATAPNPDIARKEETDGHLDGCADTNP